MNNQKLSSSDSDLQSEVNSNLQVPLRRIDPVPNLSVAESEEENEVFSSVPLNIPRRGDWDRRRSFIHSTFLYSSGSDPSFNTPSRPAFNPAITMPEAGAVPIEYTLGILYEPDDNSVEEEVKVHYETAKRASFQSLSTQRNDALKEAKAKTDLLKKFTASPEKKLADHELFELTNLARSIEAIKLVLNSLDSQMARMVKPEDHVHLYTVTNKNYGPVDLQLQIAENMLITNNVDIKKKVGLNVTVTDGGETSDATIMNTSHRSQLRMNKKKLPNIELTKFSGDPKDFFKFKQDFDTFIGMEASVDHYEKMHHLTNCLQPSPAKVIQALPWTAAGYQQAWSYLEQRYGDKFDAALRWTNVLQKLSKVRPYNTGDLEKHHSDITLSLNGLKALGKSPLKEGQQWLLYCASKLPTEERLRWESLLEEKKPKTLIALDDFDVMSEYLDFVQSRIRILQKISSENQCLGVSNAQHHSPHSNGNGKNNKENGQNNNRNGHANKTRHAYGAVNNTKAVGLGYPKKPTPKPFSHSKKKNKPGQKIGNAQNKTPFLPCCWCTNATHTPANCRKEKNASTAYNQVYENRICVSCLSSNSHLANKCPKRKACGLRDKDGKICQQRHHQSLHKCTYIPFTQWQQGQVMA